MNDAEAGGIKVFISYAHEDREYMETLSRHLAALSQEGLISAWDDREIRPGDEWESSILQKLDDADLIILLVSHYFLASKYCYTIELKQAIARHQQGTACVTPIAVRRCMWRGTPMARLQGRPRMALS